MCWSGEPWASAPGQLRFKESGGFLRIKGFYHPGILSLPPPNLVGKLRLREGEYQP